MESPKKQLAPHSFWEKHKDFLRSLFHLKEGKAENEVIDAALRKGINMKGYNFK